MSEEAGKDYRRLDGHQQKIVTKAIQQTLRNPLPLSEGGYGIPLGNKGGYNLTGCCEIKLRGQNLRVIYRPCKGEMVMYNIAISNRSDFHVYKTAYQRINP